MYNSNIIICIFAGMFFATCSVLGDSTATTSSLVAINYPVVNQMLIPNQPVTVQYTINGVPYNGAHQKEITNYPSSMDVIFRWTDKNNNTQSQPIEFIALNGLNTDPYVTGLKNQLYNHKWKLPNCHFFRRYMPSEWSFSLIFTPLYPEIHTTTPQPTASNNTKKAHALVAEPVVPLGSQQAAITVPISVYFNATLMADAHHKGC